MYLNFLNYIRCLTIVIFKVTKILFTVVSVHLDFKILICDKYFVNKLLNKDLLSFTLFVFVLKLKLRANLKVIIMTDIQFLY